MTIARELHTTTLLSNGKVLVVGGFFNDAGDVVSSAEIYDPVTGMWTATGSLFTGRALHTATLLPNGKVLVVGGADETGRALSSAELYDPATGTWVATGPLNYGRWWHTATLLPSGKVLVAGGLSNTYDPSVTELYDPATGTWTVTGSLNTTRYYHTATLLPNGKVLVAGGWGYVGYLSSVELYDPATGTWTESTSLNIARQWHTATLLPNGKVLVVGGYNYDAGGRLSSAELYDPITGTWTMTGSLTIARYGHTAILLPIGKVLIAGGGDDTSASVYSSAALYDPAKGTWAETDLLITARFWHTATLLPNGRVLIDGGRGTGGKLSSVELYDSASGAWRITGSLTTARDSHTTTLLPNGKALVVGGYNGGFFPTSVDLYDPTSEVWTVTSSLAIARDSHTVTLLLNGKVLVAGGYNYPSGTLSSTELYDPATGTWAVSGPLSAARWGHTATLLPNGKVLVVGGYGASGTLSSAELYDPATGTWVATGPLSAARRYHTATLLPNGKVLVAGGDDASGVLSSGELYDSVTGIWTATGSLITARESHTATLLPNGKVLVAGGYGASAYLSSGELYDPVTGSWTVTAPLITARDSHTATLLLNGTVLIAGGYGVSGYLSSGELYDPARGTWTATAWMNTARGWHTATLLSNGKVLVAGGHGSSGYLSSAELYDVGLGYSVSWQPQITEYTSPLNFGGSLGLRGSLFRGVSEGSSGSVQDSPADYPVVQLRSVESGQTLFLLSATGASWSATSFTSAPVNGLPPGYMLATMFVNGIPSKSSILLLRPPTVPLGFALDAPLLYWTTGGNANWFGQIMMSHDGVDAGESGNIGNSQQTWLQTSVEGPGTVSFWWKVSSETNYDFLEFYIDGVRQDAVSGEVPWTWRSFEIVSVGSHTLQWAFTKDVSLSRGEDTGWVDQFVFTSKPVVTVAATDATAGEPRTLLGDGTFTFTRTAPLTGTLTVNFTVGGTAASGSDYMSLGSTVTFAAGLATATATVSVLDDNLVEGGETVGVTLAGGSGYTVGSPASATVTISDDDSTVTVVATDATAGEPRTLQGNGAFTFTRSGYGMLLPLTAHFTVGGTAASGNDYTSIGNSVTFAALSATATATVSVLDDSLVEGDETVVVTLASGTGYTVGSPSSATVTIKDDDSSVSEVIVDNGDTGVEIVGTWTGSTSTPGYWRTNYLHDGNTGKGTKSVTFRPNLPSAGDYEVSVWYVTDANRATNVPMDIVYSSGTRTVLVNERMNGARWVVLGTNSFAAGTSGYVKIRTDNTSSGYVIADAVRFKAVGSPSTPVVTVAATDATAGEPGTTYGSGIFTFTRTAPVTAALTVNFSVGGAATAGGDYTSLGNSVTFAAGLATATKTVSVIDDSLVEGDETVVLTLASGTGYTVGSPSSATVTIKDDDSSVSEVIVDNGDTGVEIVGTWTGSTSTLGYWRTNYLHDGNAGKGTKSVTFRPNLPSAGDYEVSVWYVTDANRATNVPMDIVYASGTRTVLVNERVNGGQWVVLGTNSFATGTSGYVKIRTDNTSSGYVIADAVRFRPVGVTEVIVDNGDATGAEIVGTWSGSTSTPGYWRTNYLHDGNAGKGTKSVTFRPTLPSAGNYEVAVWYVTDANRATNVPMDIVYSGGTRTVLVNERVNGAQWMVLGTNSFAAGTSGYVKIRTDNTSSGYVIADAVRFVMR